MQEVKCQLGDLKPGMRFFKRWGEFDQEFMVTDAEPRSEGDTVVISLHTGMFQQLDSSTKLILMKTFRLRVMDEEGTHD